jgi:hypothetical protein
MTTWIIRKKKNLILNMALNFMFVCNLKKLQMWQSKNYFKIKYVIYETYNIIFKILKFSKILLNLCKCHND